MPRQTDELLFLVRAAYDDRLPPKEALALLRRHLAFRAGEELARATPSITPLRPPSR